MFNSCTISEFFLVQGGICIKAGAFGVQLARSGSGVKISFHVFRQVIFQEVKVLCSVGI